MKGTDMTECIEEILKTGSVLRERNPLIEHLPERPIRREPPVMPAMREWLWLVGMPSAHAATPQTIIATMAAARAIRAA